MKYFRMSYEEVVFRRSFINIILLNRSIPSYDFDREDDTDTTTEPKKKRNERKEYFRHESELFESLM